MTSRPTSTTCQRQRQSRREARKWLDDCLQDAQKFCQGITPGDGRIAACLKSHESELQRACKAHFAGKVPKD